MSRRSGKDGRSKSKGGDWKDKLHRVDFSFEEELEVQEWVTAKKPNWVTCLEELVDDAWSVRISPPKEGSDYWVSGTSKGDEADYGGHTFSVVYPDYETAVLLLYWYVRFRLAEGKGEEFFARRGRAWLQT